MRDTLRTLRNRRRLHVGAPVRVVDTAHGYRLYRGMVGTVTRIFEVPGHGTKIVITYGSQRGANGNTFTVWPFETFVRFVEVLREDSK